MFRKYTSILVFIFLFSIIPIYANDITPNYLVDLSTQEGFEAYKSVVNKDMYPIGISEGTEYTTHGMYIEYKDEGGKKTGEFRHTVDYTYNAQDKCMTFVGKPEELATDQKLDLRLTIQTDFNPVEFPYVVICYRITDKATISTNNIYVRDDKSHLEFSAASKTWTPNELKANGEWNYRILDMSKELSGLDGSCMGIRIPICTESGCDFNVKYVAAFDSKEKADAFDIPAFDAYQLKISPSNEAPATKDLSSDIPTNSPYSIIFMVIAIVLIIGVFAIYRFFSNKL